MTVFNHYQKWFCLTEYQLWGMVRVCEYIGTVFSDYCYCGMVPSRY